MCRSSISQTLAYDINICMHHVLEILSKFFLTQNKLLILKNEKNKNMTIDEI